MATILAIKQQLATLVEPDEAFLTALKADPRKGVQAAVNNWYKQYAKQQAQLIRFEQHLQLEKELWHAGVKYIAGVDEVGRGPLAGPVVAAAVILPQDFLLVGVNDSKQLNDYQRRQLAPLIKERALAWATGVVEPPIIDEINIYEASRVAMQTAIENLELVPNHLLIDAMTVDLAIPQDKLIKGDARSASIGAASIIAKVTRDDMMAAFAKTYPGYDFTQNAGYGTKKHIAALAKYGVTPLHRKSFAPVKKYL
ncbi:ribonuclease HII [Periweissella beninensis]|uniref:ribonuclease HII n=1 Tax=Periweissella beninensis TaxID=504936 RepID=UPI0021A27BFC|nr:ribonuclease HII [Periweissella beninensis]MCT4395520.1 ribonuclease HII [Periweissella beninensis]